MCLAYELATVAKEVHSLELAALKVCTNSATRWSGCGIVGGDKIARVVSSAIVGGESALVGQRYKQG